MQQEILEQHPDADVRVYVVWVPRVSTDERFGVTDLVTDERATHFWDEGLVVPDYFEDPNTYDIGYVFGPDASWGDPPAASGRPVIAETARLDRELAPYL